MFRKSDLFESPQSNQYNVGIRNESEHIRCW